MTPTLHCLTQIDNFATLRTLILVRDPILLGRFPTTLGEPSSAKCRIYQPMLYELMTILPSHISDTEVDGTIDAIAKLVENAGGTVEKKQNLGKIKLAYPIKRQRHGVYAMLYINVSAENMQKLDQNLRLADEVVRHMLIARPAGIPTAPFSMVSYTPPLTAEGRRANERDERAPKTSEKIAEKSPAAEEIAGKLDAILESDIMKGV